MRCVCLPEQQRVSVGPANFEADFELKKFSLKKGQHLRRLAFSERFVYLPDLDQLISHLGE